MKTAIHILTIIFALIFLSATGKAPAMEPQEKEAIKSEVIEASTKFGFKLFAELARKDPAKNIFISPMSVSMALAMTSHGASGETRQVMAKVLEITGLSSEVLNRTYATLIRNYQEPIPQVQFNIANSLWANKDVRFQPDFMDAMRKDYAAKIATLDFSGPQAAKTINAWVKEATDNKIQGIVDKVDSGTALFLVNAIYFKGRWRTIFFPDDVKPGPFYLLDGTHKEVSMMPQGGRYRYFKDQGIQAISLPYGLGRFSMEIVLPDKGSDFKAFLAKINAEQWNQWMGRYQMMQGNIILPRFKMEYEADLNQPLKALGMGKAFERDADFSKMVIPPPGAFISDVKHKTYLLVNEEGTDAAAATSVRMGLTSAMHVQRFKMVMDHPFFCAIRDNSTGGLLFMGLIVNPAE